MTDSQLYVKKNGGSPWEVCFRGLVFAVVVFRSCYGSYSLELCAFVPCGAIPMSEANFGAKEENLQLLFQHPLSEPEQDMVLDALATVVHSPRMAEQNRRILSQLADLLHCAWSGAWRNLPSGGKGIKWFKCTVPDLDPDI